MTEERKKVWVSISGSVKNEEDKDNLEFLTEGDLYKESDGACVTYEESEVSGMEGTVTTLRVDKQKVSVIRLGTTNSIMEFDGACVTYEESEVSGMEGTVTTLRVDKQKVSVIRLGTTNSIMEFESGKRNLTWYSTPFGDVTMGILTKDVLVNYNDLKEPTKVMIDYNIEIEGITNSQNVLNIKITQ